jgi:hypothetical protein
MTTHCTFLVDGTKIFRFSKELPTYIEMCVAFSPYYRQDDPCTSGAMDMYFRRELQKYADITCKVLRDCLARRFHAWYTKYQPSSPAVVSAGDPEPEVGTVMRVAGVDGAAAPVKKARYSLTLKKKAISKNKKFDIEAQSFDIVYRHLESRPPG